MRFVAGQRAGTGYGVMMGKRCFVFGHPGGFARMPRAAMCGFPQATGLRWQIEKPRMPNNHKRAWGSGFSLLKQTRQAEA
ncbi:MAG: hypothetical protein AAB401_15155 [Acidobacteriota bacterium]